jgi:hypothetical protein
LAEIKVSALIVVMFGVSYITGPTGNDKVAPVLSRDTRQWTTDTDRCLCHSGLRSFLTKCNCSWMAEALPWAETSAISINIWSSPQAQSNIILLYPS